MAISLPGSGFGKSLEERVAQLEKALQVDDQSLVLQVGTNTIEITATGITLRCAGRVNISTASDFTVVAGTNVRVSSGANAAYDAGGQMLVRASSHLTLRGSTINEN